MIRFICCEFTICLYQARTDAEREESDDEEVVEEMEEEPEDDIPYNPKNLPLGWDGKPIPYWLYKLHGLNISYNCEICGNYTYKVSCASIVVKTGKLYRSQDFTSQRNALLKSDTKSFPENNFR